LEYKKFKQYFLATAWLTLYLASNGRVTKSILSSYCSECQQYHILTFALPLALVGAGHAPQDGGGERLRGAPERAERSRPSAVPRWLVMRRRRIVQTYCVSDTTPEETSASFQGSPQGPAATAALRDWWPADVHDADGSGGLEQLSA